VLDTRQLLGQLSVAAARVLEDLAAEGLTSDDLDPGELTARIADEATTWPAVLGAMLGRGRTAEGDRIADRIWREVGV
jgi:hypothetical protein